MTRKLKRTKTNKKAAIPECKKHQPGLVCSLSILLATMTFIAGTAIGAFMVAQARRVEERRNRDAVLFIQQDAEIDASTFVIYRNGLIAERFADSSLDRTFVMSNEDIQDLKRRVENVDRDSARAMVRETTDFNHGESVNRVFSTRLNRWVILEETHGRDVFRSNAQSVLDLVDPIERLIEKYLFANETPTDPVE